MTSPHRIGPHAPTTDVHSTTSRQRRTLPADLLHDAARRLGALSLLSASLWVVGTIAGHFAVRAMSNGDPQWLQVGVPELIAAANVAISVGVFAYTRSARYEPRHTADIGLVYMVVTAFSLGLMFHWEPMPREGRIQPEISWVGAVMLMFAGLVPSTPRKTLVAGLAATLMNPISMLIARARGIWPFESASDALLMHYPDFLLVGVAVVTAHVVRGLGQQVVKAREMGSYQVGALLGRGGMGEVYFATHRMLARPAAIKLIRPDALASADPDQARHAIDRFQREARAAAALESPHTVELYDFGVTDDQTFYFVMELLDGMDLETLVTRHGPVPPARAVHILQQVCASLAEAHARGLVHRDIKPANIHVGRLGLANDFVKVLDFGLVKPVAEAHGSLAQATRDGVLMGTPAYMAPEMATAAQVDARADLYTLGCVAYYLVTGRQVFEGRTVLEVVAAHLHTAPTPPSQVAATAIPPELDRIVMACLAKDAAARPQSAVELSRQLGGAVVETWTDQDAHAWWSRIGDATEAGFAVPTAGMTRIRDDEVETREIAHVVTRGD